VSWVGFRQIPFAYDRQERFSGSTKYPLRKMIAFALDAVTGFSLPEEGQGAANLLATFDKLRPADLASVLHELSPKRRAEPARTAPTGASG